LYITVSLINFNKIIGLSVGADYAVSKNTTDDEIGRYTVTLSRSEGSASMGREMLRFAQHDSTVTHTAS